MTSSNTGTDSSAGAPDSGLRSLFERIKRIPRPSAKRAEEIWKFTFLFLFALLANIYCLAEGAFIGFHHHDWGGFWDAAWRVYRGQQIYKDFYFNVGPGHIYLQALTFKLFGIGKTGILIHLVTVNMLVFAAIVAAVYRKIPFILTAACAFLGIAYFYWVFPHPYYDYSAQLFGLLGSAMLARAIPLETPRKAVRAGALAGMAAVFSLMCKHNIGAAYGLVFGAVLAASPGRRRALAAYALSAVLTAAVLILLLPSPAAFFENCVLYSGSEANRLSWLLSGRDWLQNGYWFPAAAVLVCGWPGFRRSPARTILFFGLGFVGLFTMLTSSTFRHWATYRPLCGLYLAVGFSLLFENWRAHAGRFQRILCAAGIAALCLSLLQQSFKVSETLYVKLKYKMGFVTDFVVHVIPPEHRYYLRAPAWEGWMHLDAYGEPLDEMVAYARKIPKGDTFLIMSFMQVVYSLAGHDSYLHVPFHWDVPKAPPPGKLWDRVHRELMENPPDWLLTVKHEGYAINEIFDYMKLPPDYLQHYVLVKAWGPHALFRKVR